MENAQEKILVLDFGSQYTQLIARRVRETGVYSEIVDSAIPLEDIREHKPSGIILSGGPASVHDADAPDCDQRILEAGVPILGICYGFQWLMKRLRGNVKESGTREYGPAQLEVVSDNPLFKDVPQSMKVWVSHADEVTELPAGFQVIARSETVPNAAAFDPDRGVWGVQFHPEVVHTEHGDQLVRNFTRGICACRGEWSPKAYIEQAVNEIREQVGDDNVVLGLSGGVDSTVAAALIHRAIGNQLTGVFVDNGLLRYREAERLMEVFRQHLQLRVEFVDASEHFLANLAGVIDPEEKRRIVGNEFITVFQDAANEMPGVRFLAQGTTYPDVIESSGIGQHAQNIKSHHNVGGLPAQLGFDELVEPLRMLFKDEVRELGKELGLPEEVVWRQPFPGPGLAVRILGEVTKGRVEILQQADRIVLEEMKESGWYYRVWQSFAVLLPVQTVGVMGDARTYENAAAVRVVHSSDGMTADWVQLPHDVLARISTRMINEVHGINRVVYDVTSKPPGTIEWE